MQDNKSVVKRFMEALGKGDFATLRQLITEDAVAICTGTSLVSGNRGHADILATAGVLNAITKNGIAFDILQLTAEDDRVSCEARGTSTLVSGAAYNNEYHFLFFIRGGKVYRIKEYLDTKLADAVLAPLMRGA